MTCNNNTFMLSSLVQVWAWTLRFFFFFLIEKLMDFSKERDDGAMETLGLSLGMLLLTTTLCLVMSFKACHSGREMALEDQPIQRKFPTKKCLEFRVTYGILCSNHLLALMKPYYFIYYFIILLYFIHEFSNAHSRSFKICCDS